ncbi:ATP synthase subunit g, mitochondrial [Orchesella cincta]|uniref:ATP synthase subunit g, mitochondrial n=1 Tax=Orchesella cincta TaxID=48709 RepID=A0A1D2N2B2_ORCCI|nr:ATP synthase subunit g, mitochondrial [Orchesella cincta]
MSASPADFFHCPAYKLLISDIKLAVKKQSLDDKQDDPEDQIWKVSITHVDLNSKEKLSLQPVNKILQLNVKLVWVQGKILRIAKEEMVNCSLLICDDDLGKDRATILDYNTVPGGDHADIKPGGYVGVLGQIWYNKPDVIIKASKLMYLGDRTIFKESWRDDVSLSKAFLAGLIVPNLLRQQSESVILHNLGIYLSCLNSAADQVIRQALEIYAATGLAARGPEMFSAMLKQAQPKFQVFLRYAKVELAPPTPGDIPKALGGIRNILSSFRTGRYKQLTVREAWLNTLVGAEITFWFFVGECIGKRHLRGYDV